MSTRPQLSHSPSRLLVLSRMTDQSQVQELHRRTSLIESTISGFTNQVAELFAGFRELGARMLKMEQTHTDMEARIMKLETTMPTAKADSPRKKAVYETKERMDATETCKSSDDD